MKNNLLLIIACSFLLTAFSKEKLPIPRFVSIKSSEANIRFGPSYNYPIKWVFIRKNEPIEITAEFEQWRKIRDFSAEEGWIHESILNSQRFAIIKSKKPQNIYKTPAKDAPILLIAENQVRLKLLTCKSGWCKIKIDGYKGWIEQASLWGTYKDEEF